MAQPAELVNAAQAPDAWTPRVLPAVTFHTLADYVRAGGGAGLPNARAVSPDTVIDELVASGLRGRGGAGFPTGTKWQTMLRNGSEILRTSVVVNAAEGEPGTFKDRSIIGRNPYAVLEGALIAAVVVGAGTVTIASKARFEDQIARFRSAIDEIDHAGWLGEVTIEIFEGPAEYLFGEETALLEVLDGRPPFPRIAPPYRRGVVEVVSPTESVEMAGTDASNLAPPALVDNVETFANVAAIIAYGSAWFRSVGTEESPGTLVCTITGDVAHPGVGELPMGTLLSDAINLIGGGPLPDRPIGMVLVGVSGAVLTAEDLDTPLTYESMASSGSSLGSGGYIVVAADLSPVAVAAGVSRFLAVESCGQCTPCKVDGLAISHVLDSMTAGEATSKGLDVLRSRLSTVADGARCSLASQQQIVIGSLLDRFTADFEAAAQPGHEAVQPFLVAELIDVNSTGAFVDTNFAAKQPDWTFGSEISGKTPVELATDHRADPDV